MFSKELESLIQATLEDGILEDNEKAALVKRAQNEGVDLDELEIYINSILQKRKRELSEKKEAEYSQIEKEKKAALGKVCPKCGRQVPPLTLVCECGFEFTKIEKTSSVQKLSEQINELSSKIIKGNPDDDSYKEEKRQKYESIRNAITLFPVPNTKEDIVEFLALSAPNSKRKGGLLGTVKGRLTIAVPCGCLSFLVVFFLLSMSFGGGPGGGLIFGLIAGIVIVVAIINVFLKKGTDIIESNKTADVWRAKFHQVMLKGRSLRGDEEFTRMLDYYERQINEK